MGTPDVKRLTAVEVFQVGQIAEHWDPGAREVPIARQTLRCLVYTLARLQEAAAERDTWRAEAEDRRAEVERLRDALNLTREDRDHCEHTYDALQKRLENEIAERNRLHGELEALQAAYDTDAT